MDPFNALPITANPHVHSLPSHCMPCHLQSLPQVHHIIEAVCLVAEKLKPALGFPLVFFETVFGI
jgi:hypothetical protein